MAIEMMGGLRPPIDFSPNKGSGSGGGVQETEDLPIVRSALPEDAMTLKDANAGRYSALKNIIDRERILIVEDMSVDPRSQASQGSGSTGKKG